MLGTAAFSGLTSFATSAIDLGKFAGASQDSLIGINALSPNTAALLSPAALLDGFGDAVVSAGL